MLEDCIGTVMPSSEFILDLCQISPAFLRVRKMCKVKMILCTVRMHMGSGSLDPSILNLVTGYS